MKIANLFILAFLLIACSNDEPKYAPQCKACGVTAPQENLEWLKNMIEESESKPKPNPIDNIYVTEHKGQTVLLIRRIAASVLTFEYVYDCEGNIINITEEERTEITKNMGDWISVYDFKTEHF